MSFSACSLTSTGLLFYLVISFVHCDPHAWADNVCNKTVPMKKDIIVEVPVQYEVKVQSMCGLLPCTKTRIETRMDQSIKTILQQVERPTCCPGYMETVDRRCAPVCMPSCENGGICVAPNTCSCIPEPTDSSPGLTGATCGRFVCANDARWGQLCERTCECSGNSYCAADTGKCLCYAGWYGINCTLECDTNSKAPECSGSRFKLPPILDPEVNLIGVNEARSLGKAESLKLDDSVNMDPYEPQVWSPLGSTSLICLLTIISFILIVALVVVKRRYERVRTELYYATASNSSNDSNYSSPSDSSSPYYVSQQSNGNLDKNLSFASATRHILLGKDVDSLMAQDKSQNDRNRLVFDPRVESHLIISQKDAKQNHYSEINIKPKITSNLSVNTESMDDHTYQVPKSPNTNKTFSMHVGEDDDDSESPIYDQPKQQNNRGELDDSSSNIYEELKPRRQ